MPTFIATSGVTGNRFAVPRIPSVPKYFRVIDPTRHRIRSKTIGPNPRAPCSWPSASGRIPDWTISEISSGIVTGISLPDTCPYKGPDTYPGLTNCVVWFQARPSSDPVNRQQVFSGRLRLQTGIAVFTGGSAAAGAGRRYRRPLRRCRRIIARVFAKRPLALQKVLDLVAGQ